MRHALTCMLRQLSAPEWPVERKVWQVFAGNGYSAAITEDHQVLTWGKNKQMMEGFAFVGKTQVLGHAKTSSKWGEIVPRQVEILSGVRAVACSYLHTAFIAA